jgi:hypothetical protein
MRKGLPLPRTPRREALRKKEESVSCMICGDDHPTHQCPWKDEVHRFLAQQWPPTTAYCPNTSFPPQPQNMVSTNIASSQGGMEGIPHDEGYSLNDTIFMCEKIVNLQKRAKNYEIFKPSHDTLEAMSSSPHGGPLQIEKPYFDALFTPRREFYNT